ncbi:MAG: V-type ATP synthase subunit F [Halobacteriota archaeon]
MEIAVLGSTDFVTGFLLAGVKKTIITTGDDLEKKVREALGEPGIGILIVDDKEMQRLSPHMRGILEDSIEPTVISVGGTSEESTSLREQIKRSVGVDLWK